MADIKKFAAFVIQHETGQPNKKGLPLEEYFEEAKKKGYANDPDDLGGATMVGVTMATFLTYKKYKFNETKATIQQLKELNFATWLDILDLFYWRKWKADGIANQSVATLLVDWVWSSGNVGTTIVQHILGVKVDGVVGTETLAAVNNANQKELFDKVMTERVKYIDNIVTARPKNGKFKKGWLNRLSDIKFEN